MPTDYRFTGQREDESIGLYFYNARWYDPALGRFLQADTIVPQPGDPQSLNRYSYTLNNPVKYRDPSGHVVETAWDIANVAWDIKEFASDRSVGNFLALALDTGAVLLPFVPAGVGLLLRGGKIADKALDAAKVVAKGDKLADAAKHADDILPEAYKVAKQGGQHAGTLREYAKRSSNEIAKGIRSFQKQVDEHLDKLANPGKYYENWDTMTDQYRANVLKKWQAELQRFQEESDVLTGLLRERGGK